jgi:hypothetical protein
MLRSSRFVFFGYLAMMTSGCVVRETRPATRHEIREEHREEKHEEKQEEKRERREGHE